MPMSLHKLKDFSQVSQDHSLFFFKNHLRLSFNFIFC
ncbi:unknown protein [Simkania negevensis Z]|uniref:Uncharacterized protein n=1 Tax=Simkania negevensis (strain ATCC VR-1471 / DSM 27360 / Z) TaxID=331113 RepID=F8L7E3_SIMNZ|nr:unknown protein [Simkania negevensis Z]